MLLSALLYLEKLESPEGARASREEISIPRQTARLGGGVGVGGECGAKTSNVEIDRMWAFLWNFKDKLRVTRHPFLQPSSSIN